MPCYVMPKTLLRYLFLLLLGCWALAARPALAAPLPASPALADTVRRALTGPATAPAGGLRPPPAATARLDELRQEHEFRYVQTETAPSAWDLFWARFWRWLFEAIGQHTTALFWKIVLYGLLALAVVFVVLKLLQVDVTAAFGRSARKSKLDYDTEAENIHELDFDTRLREAEASGDYRLAVRLGYLRLLKLLTDQGLIDWQPDKTNHDYLRELAAARPATRPAFAELTRQFEYVWYGELELSGGLYRRVRDEQQQLARQLGQRVAA